MFQQRLSQIWIEVMVKAGKYEEEEEEQNPKKYITHQNEFSSFPKIEFSAFV